MSVVRRWISGGMVVLLVGVIGLGWHYSSEVLRVRESPPGPYFTIRAVTDSTITLPPPPSEAPLADTRKTGRYNLIWEGGSGRLGSIVATDDGFVTRRLDLTGETRPQPGDSARLDHLIFHSDPEEAHGIPYNEVMLEGPVGPLKGWWIDGAADAAVVILHGKGGTHREALRIMPPIVEAGYGVFTLSYRNHDGSAGSPDGYCHYGDAEWRDVVAGLRYLRRQGVDRIVLVGTSMGGAVAVETAEYLRDRMRGIQLVGMILDAPLLNPRAVIRDRARRRGLPWPDLITDWVLWMAARRSGVDWGDLDQLQEARAVQVPILLIHGSADRIIPVESSDIFARRAGKRVRYKRLSGVDHAEAWNQYPGRYTRWMIDFLCRVAPAEACASRGEAVSSPTAEK